MKNLERQNKKHSICTQLQIQSFLGEEDLWMLTESLAGIPNATHRTPSELSTGVSTGL